MEFRILGSVEVVEQGRTLPLGGGQQLALFALLLLHANEVVSTDRLIAELWAERPPATAEKIVRNYVSLLRKHLGDRLATRPPGYLLRVEPGELDSERFETLVRAAHELDPAAAATKLREALALWSGPPLAQLAYEQFAHHEIGRLEELRLGALEDRIDADLQLGRDSELVPELQQLVREHPLRERPRSLLMLALYRSGRQTEALDVYADGRRTLVDGLGLEPSPELQELQRRILSHDATLAGPGRPTRLRARRRGGLMIATGGAVLLAAGIAAAVLELTGSDGAAGLSRIAANSVGVIDPKTNRIVAQVPVGGNPTRLDLAGDSVWVVNTADNTVSRIDAKRRVVLRTIPVPGPPSGITADETATWVVYLRSATAGQDSPGSAGAALVDPRFDHVTRTVVLNRLFEQQDAIAVGPGSVWVADPGFVTRLDAATGRIRALIPADYTPDESIAVGPGAVWTVNGLGIVRIDPATNTIVATIQIAGGNGPGLAPTAVAVGDRAVWVASRFVVSNGFGISGKRGTVSRIDPQTNAVVRTITVGHEPFAIAAGDGAVWVANRTDFTVSRIDPRTNTVTATIPIGNRPEGLAAGGGAVWVSVS